MQSVHNNWIDGRLVPAHSEDTFDVKAGGKRGLIGRWPRSSEHDLEHALDTAQHGGEVWSRLSRRARRDELAQAVDGLVEASGDDIERTALALGLTVAEVEDALVRIERDLDDVLLDRDHTSHVFQRRQGVQVLALTWTELWRAPACIAFHALLEGLPLVIVSDPYTPMMADILGRAFRDLPPGTLSVLHEDARTLLRMAAADPRVGGVHLPSTSPAAAKKKAEPEPAETITLERGFGAGVEVSRAPKSAVRPVRNTSHVVHDTGDLRRQANAVVELAFGRVSALSGCGAGRVGRVLVPVRAFSRFTEELLDVLENDPDARDPIALTRTLAQAEVERAFALGHDEGATAIFTGFERQDLTFPLVFTNVEERMRLPRSTPPAPVLCLMRVTDEAHGDTLAASIDV